MPPALVYIPYIVPIIYLYAYHLPVIYHAIQQSIIIMTTCQKCAYTLTTYHINMHPNMHIMNMYTIQYFYNNTNHIYTSHIHASDKAKNKLK